MRDKKGHYMQAYLGDIAGLVSHHHSIANISFKPAKLIFGFPVKKFCLYYIVVYQHVIALWLTKQHTYLNLKILKNKNKNIAKKV